MNTSWSLDSLYESTTSPSFKDDFSSFQKSIIELTSFCEQNLTTTDNATDKLLNYITLSNSVYEYSKIGTYLSLRTATNVKDYEAIKLLDKFEDIATELATSNAIFSEFIKNIDNLQTVIDNNSILKEYDFFLNEVKLFSNYTLSKEQEILIEKMKTTGSSSFEKLRDNTVASITAVIEIDGTSKTIPFAELRNLAYNDDKTIRKNAYLEEMRVYKIVEDTVSASLNAIKGEALTETDIRGYSSILDRTLISSRMSRETFDALIGSIKDNLPELRKYYSHKATLLGHENGLPFYDLFAHIGESSFNFSYEEAQKNIIDTFKCFNEELSDFVKHAFDSSWVDALPKEGKRDGAFCSNIHQIKESRILSNFSGSFSDMSTLAHELGHAFHGDCLKDEKYVNSNYSMPIAETASIFCETIIEEHFINNAKSSEKVALLNNSITESLQVLVDIYSRFIFEDSLISERKNGSLSADEISALMKTAQITAYGDSLDEEFLHPYMWLCKPHYYSADYNYYNFPYAFGLLFAKGIFAKYKEASDKDAFFISYKNLLKETGKNSLEDVALIMDIDITKKDFWQSSIDLIINDIKEFIEVTSK